MVLTTAQGESLHLVDEPALRGGESCVYRALDAAGKALAVKVALLPLPSGAWLDEERRLLEEVGRDDAVGAHVVTVRHHGCWGDRPFLAMDWYPETLATRVPGASPAARRALAAALCRAVDALHTARPRLVHRDIKPTNVLLDGDTLRLADFGTAREPRPGSTTTTQALFTAGWAPPEQTLPLPSRPERSWDVYALAATVFFTLVGQPPEAPAANARRLTPDGARLVAGLVADGTGSVSRWLELDAMVPLTTGDVAGLRAAGVPPAVEAALRDALAPRAAARRGTAGTLLAALTAPPPRRRPLAAVAVAIAGVAGLGMFARPPAPSAYESVRIEAGHYDRAANEDADHPVPTTIVRPFRLGAAEVSQGLWEDVTGEDPAERRETRAGGLKERCHLYEDLTLAGDDLPMNCVSFFDAVRFANALSEREGLSPAYVVAERPGARYPDVRWDPLADGWRLPTETEWEYAARAGEAGAWPSRDLASLCARGNVADARAAARFRGSTFPPVPCDDGYVGPAPVGALAPNPWGVRAALGNVSEWVWTEPRTDGRRILRGAHWAIWTVDGVLGDGGPLEPDERLVTIGLRLARNEP